MKDNDKGEYTLTERLEHASDKVVKGRAMLAAARDSGSDSAKLKAALKLIDALAETQLLMLDVIAPEGDTDDSIG